MSISLDRIGNRGSDADDSRDGWGIVYYTDHDTRRFRDIGPAAASQWVKFVEKQEMRSSLFLAHIRNANVGSMSLSSTHPFTRELGGSMHTFAHNGYLENITDNSAYEPRRFRSLGATDSEWAFCVLLERLCALWMSNTQIPDRYGIVATFASDIRELGIANFIYCDGDAMFVHADRRRQADGSFREPGLWLRQQICKAGTENLSGGGIDITSLEQSFIMAASVPLTEEGWEPMSAGTLVALKEGKVLTA